MKIKLIEELNKSEEAKVRSISKETVKDEIDKAISKKVTSDKDVKNYIKDIVVDILEKYHYSMYQHRGFWKNAVK